MQVKERTKRLLDLGCNDRNYTNVLRPRRFKLCDVSTDGGLRIEKCGW